MSDAPATPPLDPTFLALLCCPLGPTRPPLTLSADGSRLRCLSCDCPRKGHDFPFTDGFPDLRPVPTPEETGKAATDG